MGWARAWAGAAGREQPSMCLQGSLGALAGRGLILRGGPIEVQNARPWALGLLSCELLL